MNKNQDAAILLLIILLWSQIEVGNTYMPTVGSTTTIEPSVRQSVGRRRRPPPRNGARERDRSEMLSCGGGQCDGAAAAPLKGRPSSYLYHYPIDELPSKIQLERTTKTTDEENMGWVRGHCERCIGGDLEIAHAAHNPVAAMERR